MNFKTTIALLVLLLGGTIAIWLTQPKASDVSKTDTGEEGEKKTKYVFGTPPELTTVNRLVVERPGKARMVLERGAKEDNPNQMDDWRFVEPIDGPTENYMIDNLVRVVVQAQSRSEFEPGKGGAPELKDAGLDAPTAVVTVGTKEKKEYKLEVGKKAALSEDTYVRVAGETKAHRVDRDMVREVTKELKDLRSKRLVSAMPQNAKSMRIEHEGKTYSFTKDEKGEWVIDEPVKDRGAKEEIMAIARGFNMLNIDEFVADAPGALSKYGLEKPYLRAVLVTETKKTLPSPTTQEREAGVPAEEFVRKEHAVEIGSYSDMKEQKRYAKLADQPWVVSINTSSVATLTPNLRKLRDARVTTMKASDAMELEVRLGGETAVVKKEDNRWRGEGDLSELDAGAVNQIAEALEDLTALDFVDEPDAAVTGLEEPRGTVKMTARGVATPLVVHIGKNTSSGRNTYVSIEGRSGAIVVDAAQVEKMLVSPLSLRTRDIFLASGVIRGLEVTRGESRYVLTNETSGWVMKEPAGAGHDANGVQDMVRDLSNLRARRVAAKGGFEQFGFDAPAATVKFTVEKVMMPPATGPASDAAPPEAEISEHTVVVARHNNAPYCRIDENPYVFEIDESVYRVMTGELIDRKLLTVRESEVVGISVDAPGGRVAFRKDKDNWIYEPDPFVKLTQKKVKDFVTDMCAMRVERYVAYSGADLAAHGLSEARLTLTLTASEGKSIVLKADNERRGDLPLKAALPELGRVFLLRVGDVDKMIRTLDYYTAPEASPTKAGHEDEMEMPVFPGSDE